MRTDRTKIKQLVQNLIDNPIKFSRDTIAPVLETQFREDEDTFYISITDNGIGLDSKYIETICDDFVQLHRQEEFEGTGLGLSICNKYIIKHGGHISASQNEEPVSTFRFTISKNLPDNRK